MVHSELSQYESTEEESKIINEEEIKIGREKNKKDTLRVLGANARSTDSIDRSISPIDIDQLTELSAGEKSAARLCTVKDERLLVLFGVGCFRGVLEIFSVIFSILGNVEILNQAVVKIVGPNRILRGAFGLLIIYLIFNVFFRFFYILSYLVYLISAIFIRVILFFVTMDIILRVLDTAREKE